MSTLASLFPSLLHSLGVPGATNPLAIDPSHGREAVLLIDGLGSEQLRDYSSAAPYLTSLTDFISFSSDFPSTTATSLASLGIGTTPNEHGMFGYAVQIPDSGNPPRILNALKWDERVDPLTWQPKASVFERAAQAGIDAISVASSQYENSGLTQAALRGTRYVGVGKRDSLVEVARGALSGSRYLAYLYLNDLDVIGHAKGVGSPEWLKVLTTVDLMVEKLVSALPPETRLWITGDHGMINASHNIDMGSLPYFDEVVIAGEGRMRHIYTESVDKISASWMQHLGDEVEILTRAEAVAAGWFGGPVNERFLPRIGDLLVLPTNQAALINPGLPKEGQMVGHHGGRSSAETGVPLRVAVADLP